MEAYHGIPVTKHVYKRSEGRVLYPDHTSVMSGLAFRIQYVHPQGSYKTPQHVSAEYIDDHCNLNIECAASWSVRLSFRTCPAAMPSCCMCCSWQGRRFVSKRLASNILRRERTLLGAPGIATRSKNATRGSWHTPRSKDATRNKRTLLGAPFSDGICGS